VTAYRQQSLRGELEAARQILEAAGIDCRIEYDNQALSPDIDTVLGWVVREGVTNVIRHSHAQHCMIRVTSTEKYARVEVSNDGYPRQNNMTSQAGSGLAGLAQRVGKQGGHLEAGPQSEAGIPGFRLIVEIPLKEHLSMEAR
jgi:two-component system sensor histidine kinase DesK